MSAVTLRTMHYVLRRADHAALAHTAVTVCMQSIGTISYAVQHGAIKLSRARDGLHTPCREVHLHPPRFTPLHISISLPNSLRTPNEPLDHLFQLTPHLIHALPLCLHIPPILDFDRGAGRLRKLV